MDDTSAATPQKQDDEQPRRPPSAHWRDVVEEAIEDAMRAGAFDNLPGKGKPLDLNRNPYAQDWELAYKLLKDHDFTLPWIAERNRLFEQIEALRADIQRSWQRHIREYRVARSETVRMGLALSWQNQLLTWRDSITALNRRIAAVNLKQPAERLEIYKLTLSGELTRAGAVETLE